MIEPTIDYGDLEYDEEQVVQFEEMKKLAESGDSTAQVKLGQMYGTGYGVEPSDCDAIEWYKKSAYQNDPVGLFMMGEMYLYGIGFRRDYHLAYVMYKRSADLGYEPAIAQIMHMDFNQEFYWSMFERRNETGLDKIMSLW